MAELYILTSPNGKQYVGVTSKTAQERCARHKSSASAGLTCSAALYSAMRKYGPENFSWKTLVIGEWDYILGMEQDVISLYDTMAPGGYNLREGGQFASMSQETKDKISKLAKERFKNDPEMGQRHAACLLGRKHTHETIAKMIQIRGTKEWKAKSRAAHLGFKYSEEAIERKRKTRKKTKPFSKEAIQNMSDAAKKRGMSRATIEAAANANRGTRKSQEYRDAQSKRMIQWWADRKAGV